MEAAETLGCQDAAAIRHLLTASQLEHTQPIPLSLGDLAAFESASGGLPSVADYDQLLARTAERVAEAVGADR